MKQIELDRRNCEINADFEHRRTVIKTKEVKLLQMIEEIKLESDKKVCECKKRLQELSLEYQALKEETAALRSSLLIEASQQYGEEVLDA